LRVTSFYSHSSGWCRVKESTRAKNRFHSQEKSRRLAEAEYGGGAMREVYVGGELMNAMEYRKTEF